MFYHGSRGLQRVLLSRCASIEHVQLNNWLHGMFMHMSDTNNFHSAKLWPDSGIDKVSSTRGNNQQLSVGNGELGLDGSSQEFQSRADQMDA
jgi:hypothetical protein